MIDGETGDHMISTLVKSQDEVRLLLGNRLRFSLSFFPAFLWARVMGVSYLFGLLRSFETGPVIKDK